MTRISPLKPYPFYVVQSTETEVEEVKYSYGSKTYGPPPADFKMIPSLKLSKRIYQKAWEDDFPVGIGARLVLGWVI